MIALTTFSCVRIAAPLILAALLIWFVYEDRKHRRKIAAMKKWARWPSWLAAVEDGDIAGDFDFKDISQSHFLRQKFEEGCSAYEAISEWRRRKAEGAIAKKPSTNKSTV